MNRVDQLPGLAWHKLGYASLSGALGEFLGHFDGAVTSMAERLGATPLDVPSIISVDTLERCGYLESFPHIAMLAARLAEPPGRSKLQGCGCLLNPAACYHVYARLQGATLDELSLTTLKASCFRQERFYAPLARQANFRMREIVAVGHAAEVKAILQRLRSAIAQWCDEIDLAIDFKAATDPFFLGEQDPKFAMQRLGERKTEIVLPDGLAVGSINFHGDFFGEAFDISTAEGAAHSGCVAFGLERWLYAYAQRFGDNAGSWPLPEIPRG